MTTTSEAERGLSVRFARRAQRGLLLGFSGPRVAALGAAGAIVVAALFVGGPVALAIAGVLWIPLTLSALVRIAGRPAAEWAGTAAAYETRKATGQGEFRARLATPRPAGTLALPGDAASLRLHLDEESGAVMVHDPHRESLTAILSVSHPAFALLDDADRTGRVARWGRVLAGLAGGGGCVSLQVLEATIPDPAVGPRDWWEAKGVRDAGFAATTYQALLDQVSLGSSTHRSTIALTLDLRGAARAVRAAGRGLRGGAAVLRGDMASLAEAVHLAGLRTTGWLDEADLARIVRHAFDPAVDLSRDAPGAHLGHAGPLAVSERWDSLRHDSGYSAVLWIAEWPRIAVPPDFLHPIVFAPGIRRSLSLFLRPLPTDLALRQIRREKTASLADAAQKSKVGQLADLADAQEYEDLLARERSVISGHTDLELTGLVSVTASSTEGLEAAVAAITRAGAQACCELRPVYGHQLQAFVAGALPLGRRPF